MVGVGAAPTAVGGRPIHRLDVKHADPEGVQGGPPGLRCVRLGIIGLAAPPR